MKFDEFEREFPGYLRSVESATVRKWKQRGEVPEKRVLDAQTVTAVTKPVPDGVTKPKSVTEFVPGVTAVKDVTGAVLEVSVPSAERGHPEFDIMSDGWARGFAIDQCDGFRHNRTYRTAHAIRRFVERVHGAGVVDEVKAQIAAFDKISGDLEKRLAFFKKLDRDTVSK